MERCPICKARLRGLSICPRCGVDLSIAQRTSRAAGIQRAKALSLVADGRFQQAKKFFDQANRLMKEKQIPYLSSFIRDAHTLTTESDTNKEGV